MDERCAAKVGGVINYKRAFVIDDTTRLRLIQEDPRSAECIKPTLRGRDLRKYSCTPSNLWLLFIPWHFPLHQDSNVVGCSYEAEDAFRHSYPAIYHHLTEHKQALSQRNQAETGIRYEWYALQRCAASYLDDFVKPKIIWGELSDAAKFTYDESGVYLNNTMFMLIGERLKYLLSILNSKAALWYFELISTTSGMGTNRWLKYKIEQLPVPIPTKSAQTRIESLVDTVLANKQNGIDTTDTEAEIDAWALILYGLDSNSAELILGNLSVSSHEKQCIMNHFMAIEQSVSQEVM